MIGRDGVSQWATSNYVAIPESVAEFHRHRAEQKALAKAKYDENRFDKLHGNDNRARSIARNSREFIVWDGEGPQDTGYSLLGNSQGAEICGPNLSSIRCLAHLIRNARKHPDAINVGFGFMYDISMMLKDLSWRHKMALYKFNRTIWRGYQIEVIPRKWIRVQHGSVVIKIFDVQSFFATSLVGALEKWNIGPFAKQPTSTQQTLLFAPLISVPPLPVLSRMRESEIVQLFKRLRSEFLWEDMPQIRAYMRLELKYTKILMETLRESFLAAGYSPRSWHGPGALARMAFKRHGVYAAMATSPNPVHNAAKYAFIGGRFELVRAGHFEQRLYSADINSAYPYYASLLPNLSKGQWRQVDHFESGKYGVYHIRYKAPADTYGIFPLPYRDKHGMVSWPYSVESWYWSPEAELVADTPEATILEGWVFDEDDPNDRPFAFLKEYYDIRKTLKEAGNPAEYTFKLIINSIYGQLAQRAGWDKKHKLPPRSHQLEWAGYITSSCRAAIYRAATQNPAAVVSLDTDGILSTKPLRVVYGTALGQWEYEEFDEGIFFQSGMYYLKQDGEWKKAKTRGIPKGSYTPDDILHSITSGEPLRLTKKIFVTYGLAINGQRDHLNTWREEPHEFIFGGGSKRRHYKKHGTQGCTKACSGNIHSLGLLHPFAIPPVSKPHSLPWENPEDQIPVGNMLDDLMLYDMNHLEYDEEWVREYDSTK